MKALNGNNLFPRSAKETQMQLLSLLVERNLSHLQVTQEQITGGAALPGELQGPDFILGSSSANHISGNYPFHVLCCLSDN